MCTVNNGHIVIAETHREARTLHIRDSMLGQKHDTHIYHTLHLKQMIEGM